MTLAPVEPISRFIEFIPGYLQNRAQANAGLTLLAAEFIHTYQFNGQAQVELDEWNSDWCVQAEWFYRLSGCGMIKPKIMVIAYSWGCGFGFTSFAHCLKERGLEIDHAILCDPVYHWGPRWTHCVGLAQAKAYYPYSHCTQWFVDHKLLPPRPKIWVPENVRRVDYFIQRNSPLRGHELRAKSKDTIITRTEVKYRTHTNMDDAPEFHLKCREVASQLFNISRRPPRRQKPKVE